MKKIVVLDGYTLNPGDLNWKGFENLGSLTVYERTSLTDQQEIQSRIGDAEIVFTNKTPLTAAMINACPTIEYIGILATGYNIVDVDAAKERGIPVCNIPSYGTYAVAQFTTALLLEICNRVGAHSSAVSEGRWESCPDFCFWDYPPIELYGKTIGLIGFGRIGQVTGSIAKAMGMEVIAHDEYESDSGKAVAEYVSLDELYARADVISLHCPLFTSTQGMINKDSIAKMRDGVIIINTSRGPLIVEEDLAAALDSGKVRAAAVDVVSKEPIKGDNPLLGAKNCMITPHIAWAATESRNRLMGIAVDNLQAFLGGSPVNVVNK